MPEMRKKERKAAPDSGWFMGGSNPKNAEARKAAGMSTKKDKQKEKAKKKKKKATGA